jgi:hypothetical protein
MLSYFSTSNHGMALQLERKKLEMEVHTVIMINIKDCNTFRLPYVRPQNICFMANISRVRQNKRKHFNYVKIMDIFVSC